MNNQKKETITSNTEAQRPALVKNEVKLPDLSLEGELNPNDYVGDVPASHKTVDKLADWISKQTEMTRANIAKWLVMTFVGSTAATFLIIGLAAFSPNADKAFIKETIPLVLSFQTTMFAGAIGYYFGANKKK